MDSNQLRRDLSTVCAAFDKRQPSEDLLVVWYNSFRWMDDNSFTALCTLAIEEMERFPTIAGIRKLGYDRGIIKPRSSDKEMPAAIIEVLCPCGAAYAIEVAKMNPGSSFPFWHEFNGVPAKRGCLDCGRIYSSQQIQSQSRNGVAWM